MTHNSIRLKLNEHSINNKSLMYEMLSIYNDTHCPNLS